MNGQQHHHHQPTAPMSRRVATLERILVDRGVVTAEQLDEVEEVFGRELGARNGARYVARAWADPDFAARLLADATAVVREHGYDLRGGTHRELPFLRLVAVENTAEVHNVVVCTLCSCYPLALLGPSPSWYKSFAYRARVVREPRAVLAEFGVHLDPDVEIRVWDSNADCRYLVIPPPPAGNRGSHGGRAGVAGGPQCVDRHSVGRSRGLAGKMPDLVRGTWQCDGVGWATGAARSRARLPLLASTWPRHSEPGFRGGGTDHERNPRGCGAL